MRRFDEHRRPLASIVFAALVVISMAALGQAPTPDSAIGAQTAQPSATGAQTAQPSAVPRVPPTPEEMGDSLMAHRRYQAAIEAYKKAPSDSGTVWNKMGIAYQMMFNLQDASHCYQTSLKLDPKNPNVLNNLGTVYDSLKQYGQAERMYRRALKIDPQSALVLKNLGTELLAQHKYKKGWNAYKAALAIDPHIFDRNSGPRVENPASSQERGAMNYYMAKGCVRAGMNDCAIEYLRMALNEGFTNPKKIVEDSEFTRLHGLPAFEQLLAAQKTP
jgi:tetratricopeptide (TPR) repeat protein